MKKRYITQETQKKNTLADIFTVILEKKQTTRREIELETGFSWGTVSSNVAYLVEKGYVSEEKREQGGSVGRTTYTVKPNGARYVSIGLDINRSGLSCEIVGLDAVVKKRLCAEFCSTTQAEVLEAAERLLVQARALCAEEGLAIFSLGIAMQGAVDGRSGLSLRFPHIPDWQVCDVKGYFARKFDLPVYLGHDPKCMLLGELHRKKTGDCILVRMDDGIGMAVSLDGRALDDTDRLELGHTSYEVNGRPCDCGRRGCLEAYAALPAIALAAGVAQEELLAHPERYEEFIRAAGDAMAAALYNMYVLFKPRTLILTGRAVELEHFIERALTRLASEELEIFVSSEVSAAYGAAVEAMRSAVKAFAL